MAQNVADLADVVEVASVVTETLGVSMGSLLAVAGPVALAVGGLYLAYQSYNAELEASVALEAASAAGKKELEVGAAAGKRAQRRRHLPAGAPASPRSDSINSSAAARFAKTGLPAITWSRTVSACCFSPLSVRIRAM